MIDDLRSMIESVSSMVSIHSKSGQGDFSLFSIYSVDSPAAGG